jgi:B12-binding domain/radical SAM domain protein
MIRKPCTLILAYKATSFYGLNVILGAVETIEEPVPEVRIAREHDQLAPMIVEALANGGHVVVAWSFFSPDFPAVSSALADLKTLVTDSRVLYIAGGVHASAEPEQTLKAGFDVVANGDGEHTIIELMNRLIRGEGLQGIPGLGRLESGKYISGGRGRLVDLNQFPPYAVKHRRFNPIEITRGCIYACKFCQTPIMFMAKFRHRSVSEICRYVAIMKENDKKDVRFITPSSFSYGSEDTSVNLDAIEELLSSVRHTLGDDGRIFFGTFPSEVRPEHVTPGVLSIVKKYVSNNNLVIGGQTASEKLLLSSGRGHSVHHIFQAVRYAIEAGFSPNVDFIFGLPGEGEEDLEASVVLAERLSAQKARIHAHIFMPLPGTAWQNASPGKISPRMVTRLDRLASNGGLYGSWKQQVGVADYLASVNRRRRHEQKTI